MKFIWILCCIFVIEVSKIGTASYYHDKFNGKKTASGEIFSNKKLTAASNLFKIGDSVEVKNISNGKKVRVKINDKMGNNGRIIDLSKAAAQQLGFVEKGLTQVKVTQI
ncbi:hypothetical protein [Leptolyngbya phage Lbo-JY46]